MKLRVLGCSGGVGGELRTTSLLVDDDILIDAGSGVGELSLEEMHHIRHVFLTHSHLDHFSFLPLLVDSIFPSIREPLIVHGQPETLEALQKHVFNWTIWPDFAKLPTQVTHRRKSRDEVQNIVSGRNRHHGGSHAGDDQGEPYCAWCGISCGMPNRCVCF